MRGSRALFRNSNEILANGSHGFVPRKVEPSDTSLHYFYECIGLVFLILLFSNDLINYCFCNQVISIAIIAIVTKKRSYVRKLCFASLDLVTSVSHFRTLY